MDSKLQSTLVSYVHVADCLPFHRYNECVDTDTECRFAFRTYYILECDMPNWSK